MREIAHLEATRVELLCAEEIACGRLHAGDCMREIAHLEATRVELLCAEERRPTRGRARAPLSDECLAGVLGLHGELDDVGAVDLQTQ